MADVLMTRPRDEGSDVVAVAGRPGKETRAGDMEMEFVGGLPEAELIPFMLTVVVIMPVFKGGGRIFDGEPVDA